MTKTFFIQCENLTERDRLDLSMCIKHLSFNADGLIPVITQCYQTGEVLMQAWMNKAAIEKTLASQKMTYWSRSRQAFWIKGETSGHTQQLKSMRFDCDGDAILCLVEQQGPACHTGRLSCFYLQADNQSSQVQLCTPIFTEQTATEQQLTEP